MSTDLLWLLYDVGGDRFERHADDEPDCIDGDCPKCRDPHTAYLVTADEDRVAIVIDAEREDRTCFFSIYGRDGSIVERGQAAFMSRALQMAVEAAGRHGW